MENCGELQLRLVKSSTESQSVYWTYKQQNATLSRKFILPFLVTHFEAKARKLFKNYVTYFHKNIA